MKKSTKEKLKKNLMKFFGIFPLKRKVVARAFKGSKYGDNPQFIYEALHEIDPSIELVWISDVKSNYEVPSYIRVSKGIRSLYDYATAKVWIETSHLPLNSVKRKGQMIIDTWHGGLGIKKLDMDSPRYQASKSTLLRDKITTELVDVFISNSKFMTNIYRNAFGYKGVISECGNAKDDILLTDNSQIVLDVKKDLNIDLDKKIVMYAPTFRDTNVRDGSDDYSVYNVDFNMLINSLESKFGGEWVVVLKMHPYFINKNVDEIINCEGVINATRYQDMQKLIMACDVVISDYSSCIFEAAERGIPCFIYATDFEEYKKDRGVYYELEELPFSYSRDNAELEKNILGFDMQKYTEAWKNFEHENGLISNSDSSTFIANNIKRHIDKKEVSWKYNDN